LSRTQFFANQPAAAESSYYRGARVAASDRAHAQYRADLALLAEPGEVAAFDAQPAGAARAAWLARFWNQRDLAELRLPGERWPNTTGGGCMRAAISGS
jgi:hypothetical protein